MKKRKDKFGIYSKNWNTRYLKINYLALRLIKECNESQFVLFKDGPSVLNMKKLEERVEEIIGSKQQVIQR